MGYDRGDSFSFDFEPNGIPFGAPQCITVHLSSASQCITVHRIKNLVRRTSEHIAIVYFQTFNASIL